MLFHNIHPNCLILKARQLGITTFFCLFLLDKALWNPNLNIGIVAHTLEDAQKLFQHRLKYAFDQLDPRIRVLFKTVGDSSKELAFDNGSSIRVATSMRSDTLQYLHISELGKICARYPERAREIVTGSLNAVHSGQHIFIESTAEGKEGFFYDLCQESQKKKNLGSLDFKFFFFPWYKHQEYVLDEPQEIPQELQDYFSKLYLNQIRLTDNQKWWYAAKYRIQRDDMLREYPSTPQEAFQASQEGFWYATQMRQLWDAGHITSLSYDRALPVHTAWDLGQADAMAIWFFQINKAGEINVIDFFQKKGMPLNQMMQVLQSKNYVYGTHLWPHDANARDRAGITFVTQARQLGLNGIVLEQHSLLDGINLVRSTLHKCWFDMKKCKEGIIALENYQKTWSSTIGGWTGEPKHDDNSHGSDAFRYLCSGYNKITGGSMEGQAKALINYWGG